MPVGNYCLIKYALAFSRTNIAWTIAESRKLVGHIILVVLWSPDGPGKELFPFTTPAGTVGLAHDEARPITVAGGVVVAGGALVLGGVDGVAHQAAPRYAETEFEETSCAGSVALVVHARSEA